MIRNESEIMFVDSPPSNLLSSIEYNTDINISNNQIAEVDKLSDLSESTSYQYISESSSSKISIQIKSKPFLFYILKFFEIMTGIHAIFVYDSETRPIVKQLKSYQSEYCLQAVLRPASGSYKILTFDEIQQLRLHRASINNQTTKLSESRLLFCSVLILVYQFLKPFSYVQVLNIIMIQQIINKNRFGLQYRMILDTKLYVCYKNLFLAFQFLGIIVFDQWSGTCASAAQVFEFL
ncbi:Hypothetical_protein [Hexamita inflata]|uniref:Hypothetical_protein n=1 Tax=Hexamita inflata TaxID=28002 RepID=A0AA86UKC3_9EUKA|nr:Hypothetical protein HINF_LOCUS42466 [Hexamita inflata]